MKKAYFNDDFKQTQAVINGTKTQFRQIVPQKALDAWEDIDDGDEYSRSVYADSYEARMRKSLLKYAQYKVGEIVSVAQKYRDIPDYNADLYDDNLPSYSCSGGSQLQYTQGWDNKMFVKADLMPHRIRIEKIRVERLQDISEHDCIEEGIAKEHVRLEYDEPQDTVLYSFQNSNKLADTKTSLAGYFDSPKAAYAALIDSISGKGTFERNPWVFVYNFKLVK